MDNADLDKFIKGNAYKIFVDELEKHLLKVNQIFSRTNQPTETEFVQIGASFHTIRGGAGFFGLIDIAQKAARLETLLLKQSKVNDLNEVLGLIAEVDQLAKLLPPPKQG